jgi:predicted DCC family thiol-disulfide oxidoreductase YuxK
MDAVSAEVRGPVVLFDGVCNFCNGAIQFIVDRERTQDLCFAPLQSEVARRLLEGAFGKAQAELLQGGAIGSGDPDSIVVIEGSRGYTHSLAALRIARHLRAPWRWALAFGVVPQRLLDIAYRFFAQNRYRWFGKAHTCRVPTAELRTRFLA